MLIRCHSTQGNTVPPPPIYDSMRFPSSSRYNARTRHTTADRVPHRFPPLILHFNRCQHHHHHHNYYHYYYYIIIVIVIVIIMGIIIIIIIIVEFVVEQ